ncbi:MAG: single-stranded-DNA-specific exonuclease RecJ [Desulfobacterales bacterium]|nr:single-stranded-DNA-specific exonuclease RecJ [Desulfobacterales bacterium]
MGTLLTYANPDPEGVKALSRILGCHPVIAGLLWERGVRDGVAADAFLTPDFNRLTNPFDLKDMDKAVVRIYEAVTQGEKIMIFGDFDADGVTATSLLCEYFTAMEADITWYIPHRIKEGYSLQLPHIEKAADLQVDLIITVDCGITSNEAVAAAAQEDIDVIVTDHHEPGEVIPPALAVVDPKQEDCTAGLEYLAGVGVAFYLAMALRKHFRDKGYWETMEEPNLVNFLDLFALGTIGDMVPLTKDNRILAMAGVRQVKKGIRPGICALARVARLDLETLDSDDISFKLVPRINAAGRISHARICVSLLTAPSIMEAEKTAELLDELNQKRQIIEQEIVQDIEKRIQGKPALLDKRILVMWDRAWNPSVLGIAASKLARKYVCPVVLLCSEEDIAMGSCRSINNINIHRALGESADLLERFGGHAMASGLALHRDKLPQLVQSLQDHMDNEYQDDAFQKSSHIDAELTAEDIGHDLACQLDQLRPFGTANPEPLFLLTGMRVVTSHLLGGRHRKMMLQKEDQPNGPMVEALHFNIDDPDHLPQRYTRLAFRLKINKFKPGSAQIIISDI